MTSKRGYELFFQFVKEYMPAAYQGIDRNDGLIRELEIMTEINDQYFFMADLLHIKILFTSKRSMDMIGIHHEQLTPYHISRATHPDDISKRALAISNRMRLANFFITAQNGHSLLSTNFRMRNPSSEYSHVLFQAYTFYSAIPYKTVFQLQVHTNIDWYKKIQSHLHYYMGDDLTKFRYPDEELLSTGIPFSSREFEIIKLLDAGFSSEQIAEKLFLSAFTVNTHRRNLLHKSGHSRINELLAELKQLGIL